MAKHLEKTKDSAIRLDKWLWAARFYKTRSIARQMVDGGKVHYNGQRCKAGRTVSIGDKVSLQQGSDDKDVLIVAISGQRRGAPEAQLLYQETEQSLERREARSAARQANLLPPSPDRRPDKKQRRQLIQLKHTK